ncbi:MAG: ankyrin repeat domain-containing protein [Pseudobdellovibrionaceae bacterium]
MSFIFGNYSRPPPMVRIHDLPFVLQDLHGVLFGSAVLLNFAHPNHKKSKASILISFFTGLFLIFGCGWLAVKNARKRGGTATFFANQVSPIERAPALLYACGSDDVEAIALQLEKNSDINYRDDLGQGCIDYALVGIFQVEKSDAKKMETLKFILAKGANPNIKRNDYTTPLFLAVTLENTAFANELIKKGADVNAVSASGSSPLFDSVILGREKMVALLLNSRANPNLKGSHGADLVSIARNHGNKAIIDLLEKYEAK